MGLKDKLKAAKERGDNFKQQKQADLLDNKLIDNLGGRGEKLLKQNLDEGEVIQAKVKGDFGQAFVVTNKHVFIVKYGFMGGSTFGGKCVSFAYSNIAGITIKTQMTKCLVQVMTPATQDNNKLSYWGGRGKANNAMESDSAVTFSRPHITVFQAAVNLAKQNMGKSSGNSTYERDSSIDQLEKLAELKAKGIVTEAEFAAKKKKLLDI